MAADPLPRIPSNSNVFIDSNVFVNGVLGKSAECRALLDRCSREEIIGITSYSVLLEVTHQLMLADARQSGVLPAAMNNPAKYLKNHPAVVKSLSNYWTEFRRVLSLNLLFLECEVAILERAEVERQYFGLLTTDSTSVSLMNSYGITVLATHDSDFHRVTGIKVFTPTDI